MIIIRNKGTREEVKDKTVVALLTGDKEVTLQRPDTERHFGEDIGVYFPDWDNLRYVGEFGRYWEIDPHQRRLIPYREGGPLFRESDKIRNKYTVEGPLEEILEQFQKEGFTVVN